jgi:hypothetical protein
VRGRLSDHFECKRHVLKNGLVRQQPEILEHRADLTPQRRDLPVRESAQFLAQNPHLTVRGVLFAKDQSQERGLA